MYFYNAQRPLNLHFQWVHKGEGWGGGGGGGGGYEACVSREKGKLCKEVCVTFKLFIYIATFAC